MNDEFNNEFIGDIKCENLYHTDFAENILGLILNFTKQDNYLISEVIHYDNLKYPNEIPEKNTRDELAYFRTIRDDNLLKSGKVYYLVDKMQFVIALNDCKIEERLIVELGSITLNQKTIELIDENSNSMRLNLF